MSLINNTTNIPTEKEIMIQSNTLGFNSFKQNFEYSFSILEKDPEKVLAQWGTDAHILFEGAKAVITCLMTIEPTYKPPVSKHTYKFNADGTVTLVVPVPAVTPAKS